MMNSIYTKAKYYHGNLNESLSVDSMNNQIPSESKPGKMWSKYPTHLDRSLEIKGEPKINMKRKLETECCLTS